MAKKPPAQRWRTLRGGTGNHEVAYYATKAERDVSAQLLANLDNEEVMLEVWSADHPQDNLNKGWGMEGVIKPTALSDLAAALPPARYTQETITSALNAAADDILEAVERPDLIRDALNLLVNAAIYNLDNEPSLAATIDDNYSESYAEVMAWVDR